MKACFSNKKYIISMQTRTTTQIKNTVFLIETPVIIGLPTIIGDKNQLTIRIAKALKHNHKINVRNSHPTNTIFEIYYQIVFMLNFYTLFIIHIYACNFPMRNKHRKILHYCIFITTIYFFLSVHYSITCLR